MGVREIWCSKTVSNCSGNSLPAAADSEQNPARARTESGDSGPRELPGVKVKQLRGLAELWCSGAAWPRRRRGALHGGARRWVAGVR